jgi:hypothetical protein
VTTTGKRIVWVSKHTPTQRQRTILDAIFPHCTIIIETRPFDSAKDIAKRYHQHGGDEMVVVAPDSVIRALISHGLYPIKAEMQVVNCSSPQAEVRIGKRCFCFIGYKRIKKLQFEFDALSPAMDVRDRTPSLAQSQPEIAQVSTPTVE